MITRLIQWLGSMRFYDFLNFLGYFALLGWNLACLKEKRALFSAPLDRLAPIPKKKAGRAAAEKKRRRLEVVELILLSSVQFFSGVALTSVVGALITDDSANYFGFAIFAPLVFLPVCRLARIDPFGHLDLSTPGYAASLVLFKLSCFTSGCCGGFRTNIWFWYPIGMRQKFPAQLLEAAVAVLIFFFLLKIRKKAKPGTMHPIYLMVYSGTRFITEFTRIEPNVFLCFKLYHFLCAAGVLIGAVEYILLTAHNGRWPETVARRVREGKAPKGEVPGGQAP